MMRYQLTFWVCLILISVCCLPIVAQEAAQAPKSATQEASAKKKKEFEDFSKVTEDSKSYEGFFKLYQKKENLYCEIQPSQLDKPFLCMISVARGLGQGFLLSGMTLEEWMLVWRRVGDKVHLVRKNVRFRAEKGTPIAEAVDLGHNDSVLFSLKIESIHPQRKSVLVNISPVFISDLPPLARRIASDARFDKTRSTWGAVKAFPKNVELKVNAVYSSQTNMSTIPDSRGIQLTLHYSLAGLPENNYRPRLADDRLGHFMTAVKDYSSKTSDAPFIRYVNRWHLEKADKEAKLSPPKEPIIFYIEKTVPHRYRPYVRQGILEWNKAFEKIGFADAIEARIQQNHEDWDPEDARYNTIRWMVGAGFAIGPSRVNPLTGQILDADILIGESWIRYWQREYMTFFDEVAHERDHPMDHSSHFQCQIASGLARQMGFMASVLQARGLADEDGELPEEFIGEALKTLTMHEVGHTLGFRHNFKASTIFSLDDLNKKKGEALIGSVMEYDAVNIAPEGQEQGDYYTKTIGPWDYWVVEYAYKPIDASKPESELKALGEIASRVASSELTYGTDEDAYGYRFRDLDPLVNRWDLGDDPLAFAKQRREIVVGLWDKIADKVTKEGMGYQRVRRAFGSLLYEHGFTMYLASRYIGGQYHHRDHRGDENGRLPFVPVPAVKQREALQFIKEYALSDKAFSFSPELLNSLAITRWSDWGGDSWNSTRFDYPVHDVILRNQTLILERMLYPSVLSRVQDAELKFPKGEDAFTLPELFSGITDAVWVELGRDAGAKQWSNSDAFISSFRRGLQREHLKQLIKLVLEADSGTPEDARSLARLHLGQIRSKIQRVLQNARDTLDDYSFAHLEESQVRVEKALDASFRVEKR
ncbi:MAG: zinc-dependent metalloprotease [Candidatus Poribacteria bacterium]|nr:zinc-dependent metalloprotease [Candidatus Poribacteria bacterium]